MPENLPTNNKGQWCIYQARTCHLIKEAEESGISDYSKVDTNPGSL